MNLRGIMLGLGLLLGTGPTVGQSTGTSAPTLDERQRRVLSAQARERFGGRWTDLTRPQLTELRLRAEAYIAELPRYHLPGGLVASARFADAERSAVVAYEALDMSAAYTGYLMAAHAYRFAVQRDPQALADIRTLLDGVETLLTSSGRLGYVPRFVGRAEDPAFRAYYSQYGGADPKRPGMGRLAFPGTSTNGTERVWLGGSNRDIYGGLNFGLGMTYLLVRDPAIRERCTQATTWILERLARDQWRIDDGQGNLTFVSPLLRTALLRTGATVNSRRWQGEYQTNIATLVSFPPPALVRYSDYTANVTSLATLMTLARLDAERGPRLQYLDRLTQMWREGEAHLNPFFAAAYLSAYDKPPSSSAATTTLQGVLSLFPSPPRWSIGRTNSGTAGVVPRPANGQIWSQFALPVDQQPVAPFQWMASPYRLDDPGDPLVAHPGVDYLLAFWMGRDASVIPNDELTPAERLREEMLQRGTGTNLTAPITAPAVTP